MKKILKKDIKELCSAQVVVSPSQIVKELIENSLDAGAKDIRISLSNTKNGTNPEITVKDNGTGIEKSQIPLAVKSNTSSKLSDYSMLQHVQSYGFRGQALHAIKTICTLKISSRTEDEKCGSAFNFSHRLENGENVVLEEELLPTPMPIGTIVHVGEIFARIPVRKAQVAKEWTGEVKKIKHLVKAFSLLHYSVSFNLKVSTSHEVSLIPFFKPILSSTRESIQSIFGSPLFSRLTRTCASLSLPNNIINSLSTSENLESPSDSPIIECEAFLPTINDFSPAILKSTPDQTFTFINNRIISPSSDQLMKQIVAKIRKRILSFGSSDNHDTQVNSTKKYPFIFLHLRIPSEYLDVNLEPGKDCIICTIPDEVNQLIDSLLDKAFPSVPLEMRDDLLQQQRPENQKRIPMRPEKGELLNQLFDGKCLNSEEWSRGNVVILSSSDDDVPSISSSGLKENRPDSSSFVGHQRTPKPCVVPNLSNYKPASPELAKFSKRGLDAESNSNQRHSLPHKQLKITDFIHASPFPSNNSHFTPRKSPSPLSYLQRTIAQDSQEQLFIYMPELQPISAAGKALFKIECLGELQAPAGYDYNLAVFRDGPLVYVLSKKDGQTDYSKRQLIYEM